MESIIANGFWGADLAGEFAKSVWQARICSENQQKL